MVVYSHVRVSADVNMHEVCYERESVIEERDEDDQEEERGKVKQERRPSPQ